MVAIVIPIFLYLYKYLPRKIFISVMLLILIGAGIGPTVAFTVSDGIQAFPMVNQAGFNMLYTRFYYRIVASIFGIAFAIMRFEYKYVDKLSDGQKPRHKIFLDKFRYNEIAKYFSYFFGFFLCTFLIFILMSDTKCIQDYFTNFNFG